MHGRRETGREERSVGDKKTGVWAPQVVVEMEYEIHGMTGAGKLTLYCKM
jgi:hypothetical protein